MEVIMNNNSAVSVIKDELKRKKMTYKELSELSGVPLDTLNNFFRGKTKYPRIDTMQAIEKALGIAIGQTGISEEDRIAGSEDSTTISVSSAIYEWVELGENILEEKGEEFFESLKKVLCEVVKNR